MKGLRDKGSRDRGVKRATRVWVGMPMVWVMIAAATAMGQSAPVENDAKVQGLIVTFTSAAGDTDVRHARMIGLHVEPGQPASDFIAGTGPFTATWRGYLNIALRDRFTFSFRGTGRMKVTVGDKVVLDADAMMPDTLVGPRERLGKGANAIVAAYTPPAAGPATARLYWSSSEFTAEPVHSGVFTHDADDPTMLESQRLRRGRELFAVLRCAACHQGDKPAGQYAMPEMHTDAPTLTGIGSRVNVTWMSAWVRDPTHMRPNATMPRLFAHDTDGGAQAANDVAAYLATVRDAAGDDPPPLDGDAKAGEQLFADLGCIACHTLSSQAQADDKLDRVPLGYVKAKYAPAALTAFLLKPSKHYQWIRMPAFLLEPKQAADLAAFLLANASGEVPMLQGARSGDAIRGRRLVTTAGCLSCHAIEGMASEHKAVPLASLAKTSDAGCLSANATGASPRFALSDDERVALRAFLSSGRFDSLDRAVPAEFAARQFRAMRCAACHRIDGEGDWFSMLSEELEPIVGEAKPVVEGTVQADQSRPDLTLAGEKLRARWMADFIAGRIAAPDRPRPWLKAKMPAFAARADLLAAGLAAQHGLPPTDADDPPPDPQRASVGQALVKQIACHACHGVGPAPPIAVFEAQGINLRLVTRRLRYEYYQRWMNDPLRLNPATRMPKYTIEPGKTAFFEVYGGDAAQQFDALWHHMLAGDDIQPVR